MTIGCCARSGIGDAMATADAPAATVNWRRVSFICKIPPGQRFVFVGLF
jgi:sorbitol-specific phosphotransferase system component IIBC